MGLPRAEQLRRRQFNKLLSSVRIDVEHIFGVLKGRFAALKEMGTHNDTQETYKVIEALMTVHNMCVDFGDHPQDIQGFDPADDFVGMTPDDLEEVEILGTRVIPTVGNPDFETEAWMRRKGQEKRARLFRDLIP